jgi:hypothetical protein
MSSSTYFHVWYLFTTSTKIILLSTVIISPLKLLLTLHSPAFTQPEDSGQEEASSGGS